MAPFFCVSSPSLSLVPCSANFVLCRGKEGGVGENLTKLSFRVNGQRVHDVSLFNHFLTPFVSSLLTFFCFSVSLVSSPAGGLPAVTNWGG